MGDGFLQVKRPNQQYQSTEGKSRKEKSENANSKIHNAYTIIDKKDTNIHLNKSPSLQ